MKKEYCYIETRLLTPSKEHSDMVLTLEAKDFEGTTESFEKYDRLFPVLYEELPVENAAAETQPVNAVLDGMKYVQFALATGIEKVYACKLTIEDGDDRVKIIANVNHSTHESLAALSKMIQGLWPVHLRGQGYRSDIIEAELEAPNVGTDGKRLNIYDRIGRELNLSGNKVKHIRKVGMVNPLHFERIETSRFTLYAAYLECVKEEQGEMPSPPTVKMPTYFSNDTGVPGFTEPTSTDNVDGMDDTYTEPDNDDAPVVDYETTADPVDSTTIPAGAATPTDAATPADESDFIMVRGICQGCNKETFIKINKNQIK